MVRGNSKKYMYVVTIRHYFKMRDIETSVIYYHYRCFYQVTMILLKAVFFIFTMDLLFKHIFILIEF
jgi:hypothetical protein